MAAEPAEAAHMLSNDDILSFRAGGHAVFDPTSHCNLRCVYCHQSDPNFKGRHLDEALLDGLASQLVSCGVSSLRFGTEGEFTIYKGWEKVAAKLIDSGIQCSYLSNLSWPLKPRQIDLLSHAAELTVSFDCYDPDLHAKIRRRSSLEILLDNLREILARARARGHKPRMTQNCVVSAQNVAHLPSLIVHARLHGFDRVGLMYMVKMFELRDGGMNPKPLDRLELEEQRLAADYVRAAVATGRELGIEVVLSTLLSELVERFRSVVISSAAPANVNTTAAISAADEAVPAVKDNMPDSNVAAPPPIMAPDESNRWTRLCVSPWKGVEIRADGKVGPCCVLPGYSGSLNVTSLSEILEGEPIRALRAALLTGHLQSSPIKEVRAACARCTLFEKGTPEGLRTMLTQS